MMQNTPSEKARVGNVKKNAIHLAALLFLVTTVMILRSMGHIHAWMQHIDTSRTWILQHGTLETALLFFTANALLCAFGFPRLWTSVFAGIVFGGPLGLGLSLPSSIIGTGMTFAFARIVGSRRLLTRIIGKWQGAITFSTSPSMLQAVLIRQLPVPGIALTLLLAMSNISGPLFITASAIGYIPSATIACFIGDTITTVQTQSSLAIAAVIVLVSLLVLSVLRKTRACTHRRFPT